MLGRTRHTRKISLDVLAATGAVCTTLDTGVTLRCHLYHPLEDVPLLDTAGFLKFMYGRVPPELGAEVTVWDSRTKHSSHVKFQDTNAVVLAAAQREIMGYDCYYGVGLTRLGLGTGSRGTKFDVIALPGFWLDVDIAGDGHASESLPSESDAYSVIEMCALEPTIVVHSGGGLHAYWCFEEAWIIAPGETDKINSLSKMFQKTIIDAAKMKGWHVDQTGNIDRVLRLPGTSNFKTGTARLVEVVFSEGAHYDKRVVLATSSKTSASVPVATSDSTPSSTPQVSTPLLDDVRKRLRNLRNNYNRQLMLEVMSGKSFAKPGGRDAALQKVASLIAFVLEHPDKANPIELAELLRPSIETMRTESDDPQNPALTIDDAVEKLSRALSDAVVKRAEKKATEAAEKARLLQKISSPAAGGDSAGHAADDPSAAGGGSVPDYSDADIYRFAASQNCTVEEFKRRWIIQYFDSFYVFVNGHYKYPVPKTALITKLRDDFAPAEAQGVRLWTVSADGGARKMNIQEIMDTYGVVARQARGSITLADSFYDSETEIYWEALCPQRVIVPEFDQLIDIWLRLLGGPEAESLLDWIATVTRLDEQTSALYLSGKASAGKTMLAHGLARLWTEGGPTELADVVGGSFNGGIARCPLVFGDEDMSCTTADLRRLIGSSAHTLKRKYLPNMELSGALRVILADNNGRMLEGEELGQDDIEAVASKFLRIDVTDKPVDFLKSLGGKQGTKDWVDGDRIAAHALWLKQNRQVTPGGRFLVSGHSGKMTRLLASRTKSSGLICEWIMGFVENPIVNIFQQKTAIIGGGKVLINVDAISQHWGQYIMSENTAMTKTRIGIVLANLSKGTIRAQNRRYHEIDMELVFEWARSIKIGNEDAIRTRIDTPMSPSIGAVTVDAAE